MNKLTNHNLNYESFVIAVHQVLEMKYGKSVADEAMNDINDRDDIKESYEAGNTVEQAAHDVYIEYNEFNYYSGKPL